MWITWADKRRRSHRSRSVWCRYIRLLQQREGEERVGGIRGICTLVAAALSLVPSTNCIWHLSGAYCTYVCMCVCKRIASSHPQQWISSWRLRLFFLLSSVAHPPALLSSLAFVVIFPDDNSTSLQTCCSFIEILMFPGTRQETGRRKSGNKNLPCSRLYIFGWLKQFLRILKILSEQR